MDSSLPVLVSRLSDRRALTRLVRAALRNEVAQVTLARGPERAEAHALDLHVAGQPPLALLAEPAGSPENGRFPLRLRPLYRAQTAQLLALLEAENTSIDAPDTGPAATEIPDTPSPDTEAMSGPAEPSGDAAPIARAMSGEAPPPLPLGIELVPQRVIAIGPDPGGGTQPFERPPVASIGERDPRRTAPSAVWSDIVASVDVARPTAHTHAAARPSAPITGFDPRRTAPSAQGWTMADLARAPTPISPMAPIRDPDPPTADAGPDAEDVSLSVSVVFEPDDVPPGMAAEVAAARAALEAAFAEPPSPREPVANLGETSDLDEQSLQISVVFEPDDVPANALAGVPSPLGEPDHPADGGTLHDGSAPAGDGDASAGDGAFFDDALANFPAAFLDDVATAAIEAAPEDRTTIDDEELVPVPPPPDDVGVADAPGDDPRRAHDFTRRRADGLLRAIEDEDEESSAGVDNEATLVRAPVVPERVDKPPSILHPSSRDPREHTPTQQTQLEAALPPRKKGTRRKGGKEAKRAVETASGRKPDADTDALAAPPVPTPPSSRRPRGNDPAIGRRIAEGKYVIESLIGSGATGSVYRATHRELRRSVAIKLLHPHYQHDPQFMTSFRGEALAASQLDHPNVMRVLDFGQEPDGLVYIVMEYLSGRTLQSLLDEERRLPPERAVEFMIQVCAALSVAHDHGIIHRDIKPDNIMLVPSRDDEGATFELVKVCDFGIAALQHLSPEDAPGAEEEPVIAGTPEYMSPEQARGREIDARSDVYACGICLYELVTGRPPFIGEHPGEILIKQLEETPKPPSQIIKGLDPILEEIILRAIQKDAAKRHQSAREMRVELKELIEPGESYRHDDRDELSIVEDVPVLDDPASGFPGFFIAFSSALLRFGRFERGHHEAAQAMKDLLKSLKAALRGRSELTFARRDVGSTVAFCVISGTAEVVDLRRLLGSQLMGSFGEPFTGALVAKGVAALTLREGISDAEVEYLIETLLGPLAGDGLRKELLSKPLRHVSALFVADVMGRDRKLSWKVGLCMSRLTRDLRALCNVRGISLKKMREMRDELIGGVARLLTRGDEVRQFILNADLVDEAVANLRGFSSFRVTPLLVEQILHPSCVEATMLLIAELEAGGEATVKDLLLLFAQRLVTERSERSDAAVGELYRREILGEADVPRDLKESIRAQDLADVLVRDPSQVLPALDRITDPAAYARELTMLESAMAALARRSEAVALFAVMSALARHAKGTGGTGSRESAALRTMKTILDKQRLLPVATTLLLGPAHQREAARQLIVIAGSIGAQALLAAREGTMDPAARATFVQVFRETGAAGWTLLSQVLPRMEVRDDAELALVEDLLRALPERADPILGNTVAKFLAHPLLRPTALVAIVPLWGERAKKPLVEALEYAEEPARIIALAQLRRLAAIDERVFSVVERILTMRGIAGEELRAAAAAAAADVPAPLRARAIQLLSRSVEGKRGFLASLTRGAAEGDESVVVVEAMGRALLALDRGEGVRALKARLARSEGTMRTRLAAVLQAAGGAT